ASRSGSMTMTLTDVDGDGHLDLYVANYKARSAMDVYPPQERAFNQVVREVSHNRFEVVPKFRRDYRVVDRPEYGLVSMQQRADPDGFYLNDGKGHFTLVPWTSGRFRDENGEPLSVHVGVLRALRQVHRRGRRRRAGPLRVRRLRGPGHVLVERRQGDVPRRAPPGPPQHQQLVHGGRFLRRRP